MHFSFIFRWARLFSAVVLLSAYAVHAEIVDRVAIAIGHEAITESQIEEELRVTALLNRSPLLINAETRKRAARRLVEQFLITRETEVSHFPAPGAKELSDYERKVEQDFGGAAGLNRAMGKYGLTRAILESHLALQLRTLQFTQFRFPTDEALNVWLEEARKRFNIIYLDKTIE